MQPDVPGCVLLDEALADAGPGAGAHGGFIVADGSNQVFLLPSTDPFFLFLVPSSLFLWHPKHYAGVI
jgi:hypothetical protein